MRRLTPLNNKVFVVLGGTGFVGKSIIRYLNSQIETGKIPGLTIIVVSRNGCQNSLDKQVFQRPWIEMIKCDVSSARKIYLACNPNYVVHAATPSHGTEATPNRERYDQIVNSTKNFLDLIGRNTVASALFISSGGIYKGITKKGYKESDPIYSHDYQLENPYGCGKAKAELLCRAIADARDIKIARCFSFVGRDIPLDKHFAIGNFMNSCIQRKPIKISGNGLSLRSYMYQDEMAQWLLEILLYGRSGESYNVGSNEKISILELANTVNKVCSELYGVGSLIIAPNTRDRSTSYYYPNIQKSKDELELIPQHNLEDALRKTMVDLIQQLTYSP